MEKKWPDSFEEIMCCSSTYYVSGPRINLEGLHRSSREEFVYLITSLKPEYLDQSPPMTTSTYTSVFQKTRRTVFVYRKIYRLEDIKSLLIFLSVVCRGLNGHKYYYIQKFD